MWLKLFFVCLLAGGSWAVPDEAISANKRESETRKPYIHYEYNITEDSDCNGHDIDHIGRTIRSVCELKCNQNDACRSFQYTWRDECILKNYVCTRAEMRTPFEGRMFTKVGPDVSSDNLALGKDTWQSRIGPNGASSRAVDGDESNYYWQRSCTQTTHRYKPYWVVDLGEPYSVSVVSITNREDCCTDRLKNYDVVVTDTRPTGSLPSYGPDDICIHRNPSHHGTLNLTCTRSLTGRYVMIQLQYRSALTLCEVKVYPNPLGPPTDLNAIVTDKDVTLVWKPARWNGVPRGYYEVEYFFEEEFPSIRRALSAIDRSVTLKYLHPDSDYSFRVRTRGKTVYGPWSRKHDFKTHKRLSR